MGIAAARAAAAGALLVTAGVAGTGCGAKAPVAVNRTQGGFTDGGVRVTVTIERTADGTLAVAATLSPDRAGFHLYSLDLPANGIDGLGIPTRLTATGGLHPDAPATTDTRPVLLHPAGLDVALPVYPDGPVTFHLRAHPTHGTALPAHLTLTYGACSDRYGCRPPVRAHPLDLPLPTP